MDNFVPRLNPMERAYGTHWTGGGVGLRTGLNAVAKKKNYLFYLCWESNTGRLAMMVIMVTILYYLFRGIRYQDFLLLEVQISFPSLQTKQYGD
jgi:hypothetical protein